MIPGILFMIWRTIELIFIIPLIGMLSWFIHGYVNDNELTPNFVLVLFIVSVLAGVWIVATMLFYWSAKHSGLLLPIIDLGIFGAFIGAVVDLRGIANVNCDSFSPSSPMALQMTPFIYQLGKACNILKACFAFGIIETVFFFITFWISLWVHAHAERQDRRRSHSRERVVTERRHSGRRSGSRSNYGPRSGYDDRRRSRSREDRYSRQTTTYV